MDPLFEILRCARVVEGELSMQFAAIRLAPLHALILVIVREDGPSSYTRLRVRLGCADSTLSSALRRLEDRGFIRRLRDPHRHSTWHIFLTRPGDQLADLVVESVGVLSWRLRILAGVEPTGRGAAGASHPGSARPIDRPGRSRAPRISQSAEALDELARALDEMLRDQRGRDARERRPHSPREDPLLD